VTKYAFSGGGATVEEHRARGALRCRCAPVHALPASELSEHAPRRGGSCQRRLPAPAEPAACTGSHPLPPRSSPGCALLPAHLCR
jgi:hypothetical protein